MRIRSFFIHLGFWTTLSLGLSFYLHLAYDLDRSLWQLMCGQMLSWITYAPLTFATSHFCRYLKSLKPSTSMALLFHAIFGGIFAFSHTILVRLIGHALDLSPAGEFFDARRLTWSFMVYALVVIVFRATSDRHELAEHQERAIRNQRDLSEAKLSALEQQIQPHFLFNTLHAIALTCREDPQRAESMVLLLSDLFRGCLRKDGRAIISIEEESELVQSFVEIQRHRFGEQLKVEINLNDPMLQFGIPFFALQTLVENAFKHGIEKKKGAHEIRIHGSIENETIRLQVDDDGAGFADPTNLSGGVGLSNLRKRLSVLYPESAEVIVGQSELGGAQVTLVFPAQKVSTQP